MVASFSSWTCVDGLWVDVFCFFYVPLWQKIRGELYVGHWLSWFLVVKVPLARESKPS